MLSVFTNLGPQGGEVVEGAPKAVLEGAKKEDAVRMR